MTRLDPSQQALLERELEEIGLPADDPDLVDPTFPMKQIRRAINADNQLPGAWNQFKGLGQDLTIRHVATGFQVKFPAFIEELSDGYTSTWRKHEAYGRMDQAATFQSTKRAISVAFVVPADSFEHAQANLARVNRLVSFLYPVYDRRPGMNTGIQNQDPLWKFSFGNLVRNSKTGTGLLGYINGITVDPSVEHGLFNRKSTAGPRTGDPQDNEYYSKSMRLNFEFTVLHDYSLGFQAKPTSTDTVTTSNGVILDRQKTSYVFNQPGLNFGNFPYKTPGYPGARNVESIMVPSRQLEGANVRPYANDLPRPQHRFYYQTEGPMPQGDD
jgi:hypothetical protein